MENTSSNNIKNFEEWLFKGRFLYSSKLAIILWFGLASIAALLTLLHHTGFNNFIIFRHVFFHLVNQKNLYILYPNEYQDVNLYGPVFSILIAPFAALPPMTGGFCWVIFNAAILYFAIRKLPIQKNWQYAIIILSSNEMMNNASWYQANPFVAACIILGFIYINKGKEVWALLFIMLATFIKIYGIVGFAFFFFSKHKIRFFFWTIIWSIVFFILPMIISSPGFVLQSYTDWYYALIQKSAKNTNGALQNDFQDISVMGMIRRIFRLPRLSDLIIIVPAVVLFAFQYLRFAYFKDLRYRLYMLCSVLLFTVIFSNGAESPTYIIAFPAVCLWFVLQNPGKLNNGIFIFALVLTGFGYSDIFTPYVRTHLVRPYSLKALPCTLIWVILVIQIYTRQFLKINLNRPGNVENKSE